MMCGRLVENRAFVENLLGYNLLLLLNFSYLW